MLSIKEYIKPVNPEQAYSYLKETEGAVVFGGGTYLKLGSRTIALAIDLAECGLRFIKEANGNIEIGTMTTLRDIESSPVLQQSFTGVLPKAVSNILGIQFRNLATAGGSVCGKYGFSDWITVLLALNCRLVFYNRGIVSLEDYLGERSKEKDILIKLILEDDGTKASFQTMRNSSADFAVLDVAIAKKNNSYRVSVGARPGVAMLAEKTMKYMDGLEPSKINAEEAGAICSGELVFGSDLKASDQYRKAICGVLFKRAVKELEI